MARAKDFESLIAEAKAQPFIGWDFSWIANRISTEPLPWDYRALIVERARQSSDLLDLDTGGGELLGGLTYRPARTVATESYPPNVPVAARRLHPLNVSVVRVEGAPDNNVQTDRTRGYLPFSDNSFHLVVNRHASFVARDVARILVPEGHFITQQVGEQRYRDFHSLLQILPSKASLRPWDLPLAKDQLESADLRVVNSGEGMETVWFKDVGALAWYLKAIPWTVDGFSIARYRNRLKELHSQVQKRGPLRVRHSRFWLEAVNEKAP
jgi:hypothetical protein